MALKVLPGLKRGQIQEQRPPVHGQWLTLSDGRKVYVRRLVGMKPIEALTVPIKDGLTWAFEAILRSCFESEQPEARPLFANPEEVGRLAGADYFTLSAVIAALSKES